MNSISAALVLILVAAATSKRIPRDLLPVHYCTDGTSDYLHISTLELVPHPIVVETGRSIAVTSSFELIDSIEAGSTLKLNVVKKGLINIPIPCMDIGTALPMGSCTYELDAIVAASNLCPKFCPEGQLSQLPFGPGKYGGNTVESVIGEISDLLKPFMSGKIEITGHIKNASGAEIICFQTTIELKKP